MYYVIYYIISSLYYLLSPLYFIKDFNSTNEKCFIRTNDILVSFVQKSVPVHFLGVSTVSW